MGSTAKKNMTLSCVTLKRAFWRVQSQVILSPRIEEENEPSLYAVSGLLKAEWCLPLFVFPGGFCPAWLNGLSSSGRGGWERHPHPLPSSPPLGGCSQFTLLWCRFFWRTLKLLPFYSVAKGSSEPCGKGQECFIC